MNYKRIHDQIIDRAKARTLPKDTYTERHHIVPKSMGGDNSKDNLVKLTAREHFIIHWLLYKIHKNLKMAQAWSSLAVKNKGTLYRYTSHAFKYAKEMKALHMKGKQYALGIKWTEEQKERHSIRFTGENNNRFGKNHTIETKHKMSLAQSGIKNPMYGKTHSKETRKKISNIHKGHTGYNNVSILINGIIYESISSAARILNTDYGSIYRKLISSKYENYSRLVDVTL